MKKSRSTKAKKNTTLAKDIMSTNLIVLHPGDTYRSAVELLVKKGLTALPVVDKRAKLLGILSEKDILARCRSFETATPQFLDRKIIYKKPVLSVDPETSIDKVGKLLSNKSFRHILVADQSRTIQGIISRRDLIRIIYLRTEFFQKESHLEV